MKKFGLGRNKTPFTFLTVSIILGLFSLIISIIYNDYMIPVAEDVLQEAKQVAEQATQLLAQTS